LQEFCSWFDLDHITPSAAQFNTEKLNWVNQHYLKLADNPRLSALVRTRLEARSVKVKDIPVLESIVSLYKERVSTINELADAAEVFYIDLHPAQELLDEHLSAEALPALRDLAERFADVAWNTSAISALIKEMIGKHALKMPKLAMPLRVMLVGQTHTPSVDALLALFPRETVLTRMKRYV
jgi:glutamyl-tRNA synthetase